MSFGLSIAGTIADLFQLIELELVPAGKIPSASGLK
jgi:hypothetical protein